MPLKAPAEFKLIGKPLTRIEAPSKLDGSAVFGIDAHPPGLLHASVVMCRSTNADSTDTPSCAGSGTDWQSGWIVFLDRTADGQFQLAQGDVVLRVQGAFTDSGGILQNAFRRLQFRNTGLLSTGASQFTFNAVSGKPSQQRRICVLITGRVRLIDNDTDLCD